MKNNERISEEYRKYLVNQYVREFINNQKNVYDIAEKLADQKLSQQKKNDERNIKR